MATVSAYLSIIRLNSPIRGQTSWMGKKKKMTHLYAKWPKRAEVVIWDKTNSKSKIVTNGEAVNSSEGYNNFKHPCTEYEST